MLQRGILMLALGALRRPCRGGRTVEVLRPSRLLREQQRRRVVLPQRRDVVAPSELEIVDGKCPVDADRFVSPPNCLRIKWRSASGGDWRMTLKVARALWTPVGVRRRRARLLVLLRGQSFER